MPPIHRLSGSRAGSCLQHLMPFKDPDRKREYMKEYQKKWYAENKETRKQRVANRKREIRKWFNELKKTLHCSLCGFSGAKSPWSIEFHHHDPSEKKEIVSYLVAHGYSRERILKEVEKCDPICSNCHRQQHYEEHALNPDTSIWAEAGRSSKKPSDPERNKLMKKARRRRSKTDSERRRKGRDPDRIPGPNPVTEEE